MSLPPSPLVGAVVERQTTSRQPRPFVGNAPSSGFPLVQHRKQSAFARSRDSSGTTRGSEVVPIVGSASRRHPRDVTEMAVEEKGENWGRKESVLHRTSHHDESKPSPFSPPDSSENERWRTQMSTDNARMVESMSAEERQRHTTEIVDQFGSDIADLIRKASSMRGIGIDNSLEGEQLHVIAQPIPNRRQSMSKWVDPPRGILVSAPASRSTTPKSNRRLRFAELTPSDIHVFASEPPSPRRPPIGLLLPPPASSGEQGIPVVKFSSKRTPEMDLIEDIRRSHFGPALRERTLSSSSTSSKSSAEEGTPEDIRRRYFPQMQARDPSLEWIEGDASSAVSSSASSDAGPELRFDLTGSLIPPEQQASLPTHLGLHHHGESASSAGYTLAELLLLARSSVAAQRSTVLGVLTKIVRRLARGDSSVEELLSREDEVRKDALIAGLLSLTERGSLGVLAVDLVWTCIVGWDEAQVSDLEGVELRRNVTIANESTKDEGVFETTITSADPLSTLPLPAFLQQLVALIGDPTIPSNSQVRLLEVIHRLSRHSVPIANTICDNADLINTVLKTFILTPIPPSSLSTPLPNPLAITALRSLAMASRVNARKLIGCADSLLRFVTTCSVPNDSPFPIDLSICLLKETMDFYSTLAVYGIYSNVASTASEQLLRLNTYLLSDKNASASLTSAWLNLLDGWMVCAQDPHRTTPHHDILWSQVQGWDWGDSLLSFRKLIVAGRFSAEQSVDVWSGYWMATAGWLEGCSLNCVKGGYSERSIVIEAVEGTWSSVDQSGTSDRTTLNRVVGGIREGLLNAPAPTEIIRVNLFKSTLRFGRALLSFSRFLLACLSVRNGASDFVAEDPVAPWIVEAYNIISSLHLELLPYLASNLRGHRGDTKECEDTPPLSALRPLSAFLASLVKLKHAMTHRKEDWLPYGIASLEGLMPGEEESTSWIVQNIVKELDPNEEIFGVLNPFLDHLTRPHNSTNLAPFFPTPTSVQCATSQYLPADCLSGAQTKQKFGLPFHRDWPSIALDHVLRSGTSPVFTDPEALPSDWSVTETDLVISTLDLLKQVRNLLIGSKLGEFAMSAEQITFACMKVFMLEHEQLQNSTSSEVFRELDVESRMKELLLPFTFGHNIRNGSLTLTPKHTSQESLEDVSRDFLGPGMPFFQFYTDFVALYDAISFMHPIFARLLLVPTSARYPLDYRKHLYGDFGHLLRTIRTTPEDIISPDLNEYLWPSETDAEMLGWYLRAVVKWPLEGFVRFVSVHHVACSIWPDLQDEGMVVREKRAKMLLLAVVNQAPVGVLREVVRYTQVKGEEVRLPPRCFDCDERRKVTRLQNIGEWCGPQMMGSLEKVFGN